MKRTLRWPIKVVDGRAELTADPDDPNADPDDALGQVIALRLLDNRGGNPFDAVAGLQFDAVFDAAGREGLARLEAGVREQFRDLERTKRARLADVVIRTDDGEVRLDVQYVNLETGDRRRLGVSGGR
jgi:hypothetical protein